MDESTEGALKTGAKIGGIAGDWEVSLDCLGSLLISVIGSCWQRGP